MAGLKPAEVYRSTIGELLAVIGAYSERRKHQTADLVSAVLRALGASFGGAGAPDPYEGLIDIPQPVPVSPERVKWLRFWRPTDGS